MKILLHTNRLTGLKHTIKKEVGLIGRFLIKNAIAKQHEELPRERGVVTPLALSRSCNAENYIRNIATQSHTYLVHN